MAPRTPRFRAQRTRVWPLVALLPLACDAPSGSDSSTTTGTGTVDTGGGDVTSQGNANDADTGGDDTADVADGASESTAEGGTDPGSDSSASDSSSGSDGTSESGSDDASACGDMKRDPRNCGACGEVCDAPSHGQPTCESGTCDVECDSGYDEVDLAGAARCSKFAGFFLLRETGTCEAVNPFTGDCTCPAGFDDRPVSSWRIEPNDGTSWVQLAVCSPVAGDPTDSWGGMFAQYESDGACAFPNPLNIPLCLCPDGYSVTSQWRGANINGDAIEISFCTEGAFEDDALFAGGFTETSTGGCATGDCDCPAGTTQVDYPTIFGGAATTSALCYRP